MFSPAPWSGEWKRPPEQSSANFVAQFWAYWVSFVPHPNAGDPPPARKVLCLLSQRLIMALGGGVGTGVGGGVTVYIALAQTTLSVTKYKAYVPGVIEVVLSVAVPDKAVKGLGTAQAVPAHVVQDAWI